MKKPFRFLITSLGLGLFCGSSLVVQAVGLRQRLQRVADKYGQLTGVRSAERERDFYSSLRIDAASERRLKKSIGNFRQLPRVELRRAGLVSIDERKQELFRLYPLDEGKFLVEFARGDFVWRPAASVRENLENLEDYCFSFPREKRTFLEALFPSARASGLSMVSAVGLMAGTLTSLCWLYRSGDTSAYHTSAGEPVIDARPGPVAAARAQIKDYQAATPPEKWSSDIH